MRVVAETRCRCLRSTKLADIHQLFPNYQFSKLAAIKRQEALLDL
jgi:hypothetical protein